jgi:hypothetical protein
VFLSGSLFYNFAIQTYFLKARFFYFLGAFAKVRKASISVVMSFLPVPPSVHVKQLGTDWADIHEI